MTKVKIHQLPEDKAPPNEYHNDYASLDEWDLEKLDDVGIVEAWYYYRTAPYEGEGQLVFLTADGEWGETSLGHCSCYGPCENIKVTALDPSLDALFKNDLSKEWLRLNDCLYKYAKSFISRRKA